MTEASIGQLGAQFLGEIFSDLGVSASVSIFEEGATVRYQIDGEAERLNNNAELVSALSLLTSRVISKQGERFDCILDFGGRYQARAELLTETAVTLAEVAKSANRRIFLSDLSSSERKLVHHALVDDDSIQTRSDGRQFRRLIIEPSELTES
jgi:spoIIIJ-associated protein